MSQELPGTERPKVISIEVVRQSRIERHYRKTCPHCNVKADTARTYLTCRDCGADLNPIEWIAQNKEYLNQIVREAQNYNDAVAKYEKRSRTKCQHCGEMTRISHD